MSVETLLSEAYAILADGSAWTKGANARDEDGKPVPILSPRAVTWDAFGALQKALYANGLPTMRDFHEAYGSMKSRIPEGFRNQDIESWNDAAESFPEMLIIFDLEGLPGQGDIEFIAALSTQSGDFLGDEGGTFFFAIE